MPNPVEGLLEVYEDMVEVLLVLEIILWRYVSLCEKYRIYYKERGEHCVGGLAVSVVSIIRKGENIVSAG